MNRIVACCRTIDLKKGAGMHWFCNSRADEAKRALREAIREIPEGMEALRSPNRVPV